MKNPGFILKPLGVRSGSLPTSKATLNKLLISLNQKILKSNNRGQQCPLYLLYCLSDHNKDEIIYHRTLAAFSLAWLGHSVEASQVTPNLQQTQGQSPKWTKNTARFPFNFKSVLGIQLAEVKTVGCWGPGRLETSTRAGRRSTVRKARSKQLARWRSPRADTSRSHSECPCVWAHAA